MAAISTTGAFCFKVSTITGMGAIFETGSKFGKDSLYKDNVDKLKLKGREELLGREGIEYRNDVIWACSNAFQSLFGNIRRFIDSDFVFIPDLQKKTDTSITLFTASREETKEAFLYSTFPDGEIIEFNRSSLSFAKSSSYLCKVFGCFESVFLIKTDLAEIDERTVGEMRFHKFQNMKNNKIVIISTSPPNEAVIASQLPTADLVLILSERGVDARSGTAPRTLASLGTYDRGTVSMESTKPVLAGKDLTTTTITHTPNTNWFV